MRPAICQIPAKQKIEDVNRANKMRTQGEDNRVNGALVVEILLLEIEIHSANYGTWESQRNR